MTKMSIERKKIVFWSYQASKTNQSLPMLTEIYYEVDEFNKKHLEKIAAYAATIDWYSKRQLGCMTMSEIMTILIYYHYSHYKNFKSYYEEHVSKELKKDFPDLVGYDRFVWYIPLAFLPMFCRFGDPIPFISLSVISSYRYLFH